MEPYKIIPQDYQCHILPYFKWKRAGWEGYIGWMSRGSFGIAFRKD